MQLSCSLEAVDRFEGWVEKLYKKIVCLFQSRFKRFGVWASGFNASQSKNFFVFRFTVLIPFSTVSQKPSCQVTTTVVSVPVVQNSTEIALSNNDILRGYFLIRLIYSNERPKLTWDNISLFVVFFVPTLKLGLNRVFMKCHRLCFTELHLNY